MQTSATVFKRLIEKDKNRKLKNDNCYQRTPLSLNTDTLLNFIGYESAPPEADLLGICASKDMSRVVRKPDFCICENKDANQLRGKREADQRLCFRYTDSTIPLLSKSEILSL